MKILIVGRNGQVAWELRRTLACLGQVIALDRHDPRWPLDLNAPDSIRTVVAEIKPDLIVNAAAYTAVDKAEADEQTAFQVNAIAPGILAEEALKIGAGLIHFSTDYVFPGDAAMPYAETDATGPHGIYGKSKLAGEIAIAETGVPHYTLRTAWVYGGRGQNFLLTMLRLIGERELVKVVGDQRGAPTWSRLIAEATALVIARSCDQGRFSPGARSGIYHLTCDGEASWCEFAQSIRDQGVERGLLPDRAAQIAAITTAEYPTPARRPAYSVLANDKLANVFGIRLPPWRDGLALCLADLNKR